MKSLWSQTTQLPKREEVHEELRAKNVVIGAGIAGILIAYLLQDKGENVIVLEANEVGSGQTKNTTAKITSQHGLIYHNMIKNTGLERAKGYAQANEAAIHIYKKIITKEGIACHYEELPSFLYSKREEGVAKLKQEAAAAKKCGIEAEYVKGNVITELPFGVAGAVRFEHQAQFHPLEFIKGIAEKLTVYEHTNVIEVDGRFVITDKHVIVADNVIFATHYPFPIVPGYYFLRQHQSRSYALALDGEGVPKSLDGMYYGIDKDGLSFRCADGKVILGGSSHRTGKEFHIDARGKKNRYPGTFCHLRELAKESYPNANEAACWAAQDCMPHDGIPFIGRFSTKHDNWYVATGFQKWGMTTAMVSAMIICDAITGRENPWAWVFTPQRLLVKAGWKNFVVDAGESVLGLTKGFFVKKEKRCTHMGCSLHWNEEEESWDCPCHGSRYAKNGSIVDNPAQKSLK